ncbi:MAG: LysE family transporter [Bacteroidales bacterium]|jgi:threonine/homoserine/homoserine lactone efflux protein
MIESLVNGFIVGMGASIPLGPMGVMCVQKTLGKGRNSGFIAGLGSAITDMMFAAIAIMGLAYMQKFIDYYENYVLLFGGLAVALIGLKIFLTNPVKQIRMPKGGKKHLQDFFSAIVMTITNPGGVFLIIGMFAFVGMDVDSLSSGKIVSLTLLGVFLGASAWWFILSTTINIFRNKFRLRQLLMINRVSGFIIIVLGFISTAQGIWQFISPYFFVN